MSEHDAKSPPPVTYTARVDHGGPHLTCKRCKRVHAFPVDGAAAIRCECGWRYENRGGVIIEEFTPRLGV
ncbi:MAG: hypothetical protein NVS3B16_20130 [Vulcanimicrobiaceae bacterium]